MNNKKEKNYSPYILLGGANPDTEEAKKILDEAEVNYRFAYTGDKMPGDVQLLSGLQSWIGLGRVGRIAKRHKRHLEKLAISA